MAPFPYLPMTAIMAGLVSQQVVIMSIFAYAGFMVEYLGAVDDKDQAGSYAGMLSSGFMIGRIVSSNFWGLVDDRYGSRCVLICGLVSTAVLSTAFGFSTNFVFAFVCRFLLGLFNGMMAASRTMVTDVCGTEHATVGMGLITSAWSLGAVLGPGVGGMLVGPADHYPGTFSQGGVFGRNPYLLSNLVGAVLALVSIPLVLLHLPDPKAAELGSLPAQAWYSSWCSFFHRGGNSGDMGSSRNDTQNAGGEELRPTSPNDIDCVGPIEASDVRAPSWVQLETMPPTTTNSKGSSTGGRRRWTMEALGFKKSSWKQPEKAPPQIVKAIDETDEYTGRKPSWMQPVTMTPTLDERRSRSEHDTERAGRNPKEVKQESLLAQRHVVALLFMEAVYAVFFACGLMVLLFELVAVPYLTPWLGVQLSQRLGSAFEVPIYVLFPFLSRMGGGNLAVTLTALVLLFTCYICTNSFYVGTALAINNATGTDRRGELNGISSMISSFTKAVSPIVSGSLFAYSINSDHGFPVNHHLAFALLGSMRFIAACIGWNRITDNGNME